MNAQKIRCPDIEEIRNAALPGTRDDLRKNLTERLYACQNRNDVVDGTLKFLEDNEYDYDLLYQFISSPSIGKPKALAKSYITYIVRAAAVLAVIFCSITLTRYIQNTQYIHKVKQYAIQDNGIPVFAGNDTNIQLNEMMSYYKKGELKKAMKIVRKIEGTGYRSDTLCYYAALMHFNNNNFERCINECNHAILINNTIYLNKSKFLKGLALIATDEKSEAKKLFLDVIHCQEEEIEQLATAIINDREIWQ
jgi:hypothetical protein